MPMVFEQPEGPLLTQIVSPATGLVPEGTISQLLNLSVGGPFNWPPPGPPLETETPPPGQETKPPPITERPKPPPTKPPVYVPPVLLPPPLTERPGKLLPGTGLAPTSLLSGLLPGLSQTALTGPVTGSDEVPGGPPPGTDPPPPTAFNFAQGIQNALGLLGGNAHQILTNILSANLNEPFLANLFQGAPGGPLDFNMANLVGLVNSGDITADPRLAFLNTILGIQNPANFNPDFGLINTVGQFQNLFGNLPPNIQSALLALMGGGGGGQGDRKSTV